MEYNYRVLASLPNTAYCLNSAKTALVDLTNRVSSIVQQPRTNLATNPSGETAGAGWLSNNPATWTVSDDTTVKRSGTKSKKSVPVTAGAQTNLLSIYNVGGAPFPVTPGRVYTFSAYFAHNAAVNVNSALTYTWLDSGGAAIGTTVTGPAVTHVGGSAFNARPFVTTVPAPSNAVTVRIGAASTRSTGNTVAGESAWIDDFLMEEGYDLRFYFDGRTSGGSWTGTADASTSTIVEAITSTYAILANGSLSYYIAPQNRFAYTTSVFQRGQEAQPFAIESWFLPSYNTTGNMSILSHTGAFDGLWFDGNKVHFTIEFATLPSLDVSYETNDFPDAMHVVGVYTPSKIQLYVDGVMRAQADVTDAQIKDGFKTRSASALYAGVGDGSNVSAIQDGVATYGRAIKDSEIYLHFISGRKVLSAADIVGLYGGNMFDGTRRTKNNEQIWEVDNWTELATYADVDLSDGTLSPMNDFSTGLSMAGTWTGTLPVAPGTPETLYGVRLDWDADGSYTVQASINDGATWFTPVNGQNLAGTYNWTPSADTSVMIKVAFAGGIASDPSEFRRVRLTAFNSKYVNGTDSSRVIELNSVGVATNIDHNEPIEANYNAGFNVTTGQWFINPDTDVTARPIRSLGMWVKATDMSGVTGRYIFDNRPAGGTEYLWSNGSNLFAFPAGGTLYINGQSVTSSQMTMAPGVWYHIIYVFGSDITTRIDSNTAGPKNYSVINTYPTALTASDAATIYALYTGPANTRLATDANPVSEPATPYNLYAYDWSITPAG